MISFDLNFSSEQLNLAARHRNVYYDTVGGDPYGEWITANLNQLYVLS